MSADAEKDDVVDRAESEFGADDASNETKENNTGSDDSTKDETDGDSLLTKDKYIILKCEKCLKVFGTRHSLVRHLKRSSICGTNPERHRCGTCHRVYATRNGLHRHQRSSLECKKAGDISDDHNTSTEDKSIVSTVLSPNSKSVKEVSEPSTPLSSIASGNLSMSNAPSASSSPRESIASSPSSKPTTPSKSDTSNDLSLRGKSMTPKKSPTDDVPSTPHKDTIFNLPCKMKNDESLSCEKCNETFVSKEALENHKQCSHSDVERKSNKPEGRKSEQFTCDKCGKLYTSKNGLKEHIKNSPECHLESPNKPGSSKTERRFKCEKCGKVFMARGDLMEHLKSSTTCSGDSEGTPCKYCGKPYIKINSLRRHERNHKENNSLQCPFCTKCFSTETGIKSHIEKIHDKKADEFIHLPEKRKSTSQSNSSRSKTKSAVVAKKDDTPPVVNSKTQSAINLTGVKSDVDHVLPGKTSHQTNLQKVDHISDQSNINPYANTFKTNVYNPDNHINYPNIHEQICSPQAGSYKVEQLPHELNFNHNYDNKANHIIDPSYSNIHHLKPNQYHDYRNVNPSLQNFKDGTNLRDNIPGTSHQTMNTNIVNTKEIDDIIDHVLASQLNNPQQMSTPKPEYMSNQGNIHEYMNTNQTNMYSHTSPPFHSNSHDRTCTPETSTYKKEHIPNQVNYNQFLNSSEFTSNENPPMTRLDFSSERLGLNPHSSNQYRSPQVNTTSTTPIPSHNYISESINITQQDNYPGGDIPISEQPNAPVNFNSEISNTNIGAPGNTYFRDHLNPFLTNYIQYGISGETQTASMSQNFTHTNINEKDSTHASTSSSASFQDAYSPYHASCSNSADKTQITNLTCEEPMLTDLDYRPDTDEQATEKSFTVLTPARLSTNHSQPSKFFPNEYYNPIEGHPQGSMNSSLTGIPYTESVDGPSHMYQNDYLNRVHQYPYRKNYDSVQDNPMNQNFTTRNDMPMQPLSHHNNSERDDGTQNVSTFRDRINYNPEAKLIKCMFCSKTFCTKSGLRYHTKKYHPDKLHTISSIPQMATQHPGHIQVSTNQNVGSAINETTSKGCEINIKAKGPLQCLSCDKTFFTKPGLKGHTEKYHNNGECSQGQQPKDNLNQDPEQKRNEVAKNECAEIKLSKIDGTTFFHCMFCEKRFSSKNGIRWHTKKHHSLEDFQKTNFLLGKLRKAAPRAETSNIDLSRLSDVQPSIKLVKNSSGNMQEIKSFECLMCDKSFAAKNGLKSHVIRHHGDKPFIRKKPVHLDKGLDWIKCTICEKRFLTNSELRCHLDKDHDSLTVGVSSNLSPNGVVAHTVDDETSASAEHNFENKDLLFESSSDQKTEDVKFSRLNLDESVFNQLESSAEYTIKREILSTIQDKIVETKANDHGAKKKPESTELHKTDFNFLNFEDIRNLTVPNNKLNSGSSSAAAQNDSILLYDNIIQTTDIAPLYTCEICKMPICKCDQRNELSVPNNNLNSGSSSAAAQNDTLLSYNNIIQTTDIAPLYTCEICKMQFCKCDQRNELSVPNNNLNSGSSSAAAQNDTIRLYDNLIQTTDIAPLYTCEICKMQFCKCDQRNELSVPNNNLNSGSSSAAAQNDSILSYNNIIQTTDIVPLYTCEICKMQFCKCDQRDEFSDNISAQIDNADFMCKLCPAVFSGSIDLLRHTILEHKKMQPANENINEEINIQGDEFNNTGFDIENQNYSQENTFREIETDILKEIETDILKEIETDTLKEIESDILKEIETGTLKEIETDTLNYNPVIEEDIDSTTNSVHCMNEANENKSTNEIGNRNRKSFACKKCNKIFDEKSALVLHKKEHLMPQTFHCQFCPRSFCRKKFFLKHVLNKHSNSPKLEEIKTEDQKSIENDTNQRDETVLSNPPIGTTETEVTVSNTTATWNQDNQNNVSNEVVMDSGENKNTTLVESQQPTTSSQKENGILPGNGCQTNIIKTDVCFAKDTITEKISESSKSILFNFSSVKILHLMDHVKTPYGCKFCNRIFPNSQSLVRHATQKHKFDITLAKKMTNFSEVNLEGIVAQIAHKDANDQVISHNLECSNKSSELPEEKVRLETKMIKSTCKICNRTFDTKKSLKLHMMEHVEQPSACSDCGRLFPTRRSLMRHRIQKHRETFDKEQLALRKVPASQHTRTVEQPSLCSDCGRLFSTRRSLMRHRVQKHRESFDKEQLALRKVPSSQPKSNVTTKEVLEKRKYNRTLQSEYTCNICNEKFNMKKLLRLHMQQHLKDGPMTCPICNRVFATRLSLIKHNIQIHKKRNKFRRNAAKNNRLRSKTCDICQEEFEHWKEMRIHRRTHDSKGPVKCEICDAVLATKSSLKRHMDKVHDTVVPERSGASTSKGKVPLVRILEKKDYISPHAWAKDSKKGHVFDDFDHLSRKEISYLEHRVDDKKMMEKMGLREFFLDRFKNESDAKNASKQNSEVSVDKNQKDNTIETNDQENVEPELFVGHIKLKKNFEKMLVTKFGKCLQIDFPESLENEFYIPFDYEDDIALEFFISDEKLLNNLNSIVIKLFDKSTLDSFGWPETSAEKIVSEVVTKCGRVPGVRRKENITSHIRQNFTLLFKYVINTDVSKKLLSVHTVDELILQILKFNEN